MGIELDIRGNVLRDGLVEPSDAPEFWSVYRREQDGLLAYAAECIERSRTELRGGECPIGS